MQSLIAARLRRPIVAPAPLVLLSLLVCAGLILVACGAPRPPIPSSPTPSPLSLVGGWQSVRVVDHDGVVIPSGSQEVLDLAGDGTVVTSVAGSTYRGAYRISGTTLEYVLQMPQGPRQSSLQIVSLGPPQLVLASTMTGLQTTYHRLS